MNATLRGAVLATLSSVQVRILLDPFNISCFEADRIYFIPLIRNHELVVFDFHRCDEDILHILLKVSIVFRFVDQDIP